MSDFIASTQGAVRAKLCEEAMRLTALLRDHPVTRTPATFALSALMALHAARLPARIDAAGDELTAYHVEAAIAAIHAAAPTLEATDWNAIAGVRGRSAVA